MNSIIRCHELTMRFPGALAVDGLTFAVEPGEVFGIVGPDGAGKTTSIRLMCGIMAPTAGYAETLGARMPEALDTVVSDIGYMSQRFSLYGDLTVAENIEFFADIHQVPAAARRERTERLLHASRMEPFTRRLAQNLSGGMKQKLALVCTLVHTPKVLFLDEPTTGVDPVSRREFWQILYGLVADGMTLVVSTPYMDEADRCQRLGLMDHGRLVMCDTPENLRRSIRRTVVEFSSTDPRAARAALRDVAAVRSVEAFGERLHATVGASGDVPIIQATLDASGLTASDLRVIAPSLEDAFIAYLEEGADASHV